MSPSPTHCLWENPPILGTGELPVPNISSATITTFNPPAGVGNRRGVIVWMHGLYNAPVAAPVPFVPTDTTISFGAGMNLSSVTNFCNDGWIVLCPPYAEDPYQSVPAVGVANDIANDSTNGARFLRSTLNTWDHVYAYIQQTYGSNFPVGLYGGSEGSWKTLQIVLNRTSQIAFFMAGGPPTIWSSIGPSYENPGVYNFQLYNTSGMDLGPTALNGLPSTLKGFIGYGTSDTAVFFGGNTTIGSGSASTVVNGTNFSGSQSLTLTNTTNFWASAEGAVTLTGLTGGTGRATLTYSGVSGNTLTNCQWISGSGTLNPGVTVAVQSNIDSILTAAAGLGLPITRLVGVNEIHDLTSATAGIYVNNVGGYILTSTPQTILTGLISNAVDGPGLTAGACAIKDASGTWRQITFTQPTGNTSQITNVALATGSGPFTIPNGAPICNTGSAITGGFNNMSHPYWLSTVIDPSYPATL